MKPDTSNSKLHGRLVPLSSSSNMQESSVIYTTTWLPPYMTGHRLFSVASEVQKATVTNLLPASRTMAIYHQSGGVYDFDRLSYSLNTCSVCCPKCCHSHHHSKWQEKHRSFTATKSGVLITATSSSIPAIIEANQPTCRRHQRLRPDPIHPLNCIPRVSAPIIFIFLDFLLHFLL